MFKWPKAHIGQIFGYILENKAFSTDYIGQYKVRKAFSLSKSGVVHKVYVKTINAEGVLLKAAVTPSQRIRDESHKVWVLIKLSGEVVWVDIVPVRLAAASAAIMSLYYSAKWNLQENTG